MRVSANRVPVSKRNGFNLVELLFAISLVSLISVFLATIVNTTSSIWRNNQANVESCREARAALTLMSHELSSLCAGKFPDRQSFVINPEQSSVKQIDIAVDEEWANRIFFLTTIPSYGQRPGANRSNLCAVGYFLAYTADRSAFARKADSESNSSYKLYRFFRSSDPTFHILSGNDEVTPLFEANPAVHAEVLATGITRFTVKAFATGANGLIEWNPADDLNQPEILELSISAIGTRPGVQLRSRREWENHNSAFHRRNERTFTTRVRLRSRFHATPTS